MEKERIKKQNMEDLSHYETQLWISPKLTYLFFELTDKCNLNCLHCGSRCDGHNNTFLPVWAVEKTLSEIASKYDPSSIMVNITGGEPVLHPSLFEIIRTATRMGFPVGMTTNGTLIDRDKAERLRASGIKSISVSLDGLENVHDSFRRNRGCYQKAILGIRNLKKAGIEPEIITVIHKNNIHQLQDIYRLLVEMDVYAWRIVSMDPMGRGSEEKELLLDGIELKRLLEYVRDKRNDNTCSMLVNYGCSHFLSFEYENEVRDYYFQCIAGTKTASIRANGNIVACLDIEPRADLVQGNVDKDNFAEVWEDKFRIFRTDRTEGSSTCKGCEHRYICRGDSAHTWNYDMHEPLYCAFRMMEGLA